MRTSELDLLTPTEAAEQLLVTDGTIRDLVRRGKLRAYRLGDGPKARLRIERAELLRFLHRDQEREVS
jgi:excisionase family DNA binding protein